MCARISKDALIHCLFLLNMITESKLLHLEVYFYSNVHFCALCIRTRFISLFIKRIKAAACLLMIFPIKIESHYMYTTYFQSTHGQLCTYKNCYSCLQARKTSSNYQKKLWLRILRSKCTLFFWHGKIRFYFKLLTTEKVHAPLFGLVARA